MRECFEAIVTESDFVRTHNAATFVYPHGGRHVDHVVFLRDDLLVVDERGELRFRGDDPWTGVFRAASVFGNGDDFKILVLQFLVERLPAWQVKAAASP